jgi:quercetin dioxygenase-like cupin family protein
MKVVDFSPDRARPIELFGSVRATSVPIGDGSGAVHVYAVRFAPGGSIGRHEAGFDQLFLVVEGSGWAEGDDGVRVDLPAGRGAFFRKGEVHAKGSEGGAAAIMVQADRVEPVEDARFPGVG